MVNDGIGNGNFTTLKPFAFWTQHVLPLVYGDEISYMETLDKVVKLLNELIKNNNKLPEYIQQIVEEYITGGPLEEVLRGILADFILNVKYPPTGITPAKGDGTANDYEAIQGCIDYAASKGGGVVYFPFGKYLTSKLTLKPNVSLMGFGKYCTSIVLTGGETDALLSGTVIDCGIYNITLDANMSIQVNDVDVLTLTGSNIQLMNVILTDGYSLFNIEKTGDNIELNNVEFRYAVESMLRIGGNVGSVNADSVTFGSLSTIKGVAAIISDSDNDVITGIVSNKVLPLFAELNGSNNVLKGRVVSDNLVKGDGQNNVYDFYGKTKVDNYSGDVGETVHGNKSVHISGMSTFTVDNNSTESVDGTKSEIVTGVSSAQYKADRSVNGTNLTETLNGKKVINATDIVLNPTNPLTYKEPEKINEQFSYVPAKSSDGKNYKILVAGDKLGGTNQFLNVTNYGAIGDGVTDDTQAFKDALSDAKTIGGKIFIPVGNYKLTDYIVTDEKYVGENLGIYPNDKLIYSVNLKDSSFASDFYKAIPMKLIKNDMSTGGQQSAVYIPNRDVIVIGFSADSSNDSLLVEMSTDFTTVKRRVRAHLGHCNDLTYNPDTNKIYVSIYDLGSGIIGVVNPVSLSVEGTVTISGITTGITMVRYDTTNKVYYMMADALYITDSNFVIIKKIAIDKSVGSLFIPNDYSATQGSEMVNGMFVALTWISNAQYCESARLLTVDYETGKVKNYYDYPVFHKFDEPESLVVIDDSLLIIGYEPNNLLIRKVNIKETGSVVNPVDVNKFTSTEYTLYVDETKSINGSGLTKSDPINDLEYALKLAKFNQYVTIDLLANTVKTGTIYFEHYRGFLLIKGDTGIEEISRHIDFGDVNTIRLENIVVRSTTQGSAIRLRYSECYVYENTKFVGNNSTAGNVIAVDCTVLSRVHFENAVFNNCDLCLRVGNGGYAMMWNCSGSGNNTLAANNGGLIMLTTLKPSSTTISTKNQYGGLTVLNAQEIPTDYPQVTTG